MTGIAHDDHHCEALLRGSRMPQGGSPENPTGKSTFEVEPCFGSERTRVQPALTVGAERTDSPSSWVGSKPDPQTAE